MKILIGLLPQELVNGLVPLLLVFAGTALILQMKRSAMAIIMMVVALTFGSIILDLVMAQVFEAIPNALFWPLMVMAAIVLGMVVLHRIAQFFFGQGTANRMMASLLAGGVVAIMKLIVTSPIRFAWWLLKACIVIIGRLINGRGVFNRFRIGREAE